MPAAITHFLLAQKALDEFQKNSGVPIVKDAFIWGAQGPDILFFDNLLTFRKGENLRGWGTRMHDELPSRLLSAMRDCALNLPESDPVRSYLYGFLCHYALDRTAHPFVYWQVETVRPEFPGRSDDYIHAMIESALDVIILRYEREMLPTSFDLKQTVPKNPEAQAAIAKLYAEILDRLYAVSVSPERVLRTLRDCRRLMGLSNDRTTFKKPLLEAWEKRTKHYQYACQLRGISEEGEFDYANIMASEWRWPTDGGKTRTESFFDLYESSALQSVELMKEFYLTDDLSRLTGEIPFC